MNSTDRDAAVEGITQYYSNCLREKCIQEVLASTLL